MCAAGTRVRTPSVWRTPGSDAAGGAQPEERPAIEADGHDSFLCRIMMSIGGRYYLGEDLLCATEPSASAAISDTSRRDDSEHSVAAQPAD